MINSERKAVAACGVCQEGVDGPQLRKCVGMAASMLFYGLTREQINPALTYLGETPLAEKPDLRVWCPACAELMLSQPADGRPRDGRCVLCLERVRAHAEDLGLLPEPGCDLPGQPSRILCLNCRIHVFYKEGRL